MQIREDLVAKALLQDTVEIYTPRWDNQKMMTVYLLEENNKLTYAFYYNKDKDTYIPMTKSELIMLRETIVTATRMSVYGKAIDLKREYYRP